MEHAYLRYADKLDLSGSQITELMCAVIARGGTFRFRAGGSSMFPFIRDGDLVSIVSLPSRTPRLGAVIAFRRADPAVVYGAYLVVHRLVRKTRQGFHFLGDNQCRQSTEGPLDRSSLMGEVARVERRGRGVRFGLGPERILIAFASQTGLLRPSIRLVMLSHRAYKKLFTSRKRIL